VIATLQPRARTIERHVGLQFERSFDALDELEVAVIETPSATRVALVDHLDAPVPATEVHARVADAREAEAILREVLAALQLSDDMVSWRRHQSE